MSAPHDEDLLADARRKVTALLDVLTKDQTALKHNQADLPPESVLTGIDIYTAAIDAARGTLDNLNRSPRGAGSTHAATRIDIHPDRDS